MFHRDNLTTPSKRLRASFFKNNKNQKSENLKQSFGKNKDLRRLQSFDSYQNIFTLSNMKTLLNPLTFRYKTFGTIIEGSIM